MKLIVLSDVKKVHNVHIRDMFINGAVGYSLIYSVVDIVCFASRAPWCRLR